MPARSRTALAFALAWSAAVGQGCGGCVAPQAGDERASAHDSGTPGSSSDASSSSSGDASSSDPSADGATCGRRLFPGTYNCQGTVGPLAEALQKALWFFHVNRCGAPDDCTYVQWRGRDHVDDAHIKLSPNDPNGVNLSAAFIAAHTDVLDPDHDGTIDVSGGFHDAGDYPKFGLTTAFSASMLAWSFLEFPEAYRATGLNSELKVILRLFGDFMARNVYLDAKGDLVAYAHQVGDGSDHTCGWMPPELRRPSFCPRKAYFASDETPAADVTASAAAALAQMSLVFKDSDPAVAAPYLAKAKALYRFAAKYPDKVADTTGGLYPSEYAWDDLSWAGVNLYEATQDEQYLKDVFDFDGTTFTGWAPGHFVTVWVPTENDDGMDWAESWTHCWNSLRTGVFVKLAAIFDAKAKVDPNSNLAHVSKGFRRIAYHDSIKWAEGGSMTPGGFNVLATWGSGRYNSASQFVALVYAKHFPADAAPLQAWAKRQIAYLLGDNPIKSSYMMGFGPKYESHPHHAAGHASIYGDLSNPPENRHIVWGALLNGPSDGNDGHHDERTDYGANEVAIDYNAPFTAALAAHVALEGQGQCPLPDFPPEEPPIHEFWTRSKVNAANACNSQVEIALINETVHVPRFEHRLKVRYFFDVSELAGREGRLKASLIYDRGAFEFGQPVKFTGPTRCQPDSNVFYVELDYAGQEFWGEITKLKGPPTVIVEVGEIDDGTPCVWAPANDWSYRDLTNTSTKSFHVPVYLAGRLVFGDAPLCAGDEPKPTPTPTPTGPN